MKKSELIKDLGRIAGDPEIKFRIILKTIGYGGTHQAWGELDRINEFPSPEIIIVEK